MMPSGLSRSKMCRFPARPFHLGIYLLNIRIGKLEPSLVKKRERRKITFCGIKHHIGVDRIVGSLVIGVHYSIPEIMDTDALKKALKQGQIQRCVIDVWENEPAIDRELMDMSWIGGIMPDITTPIDTSDYTDYWAELSRRGVLAEYVVNHLDAHRAELQMQYATDDAFVAQFEVSDAMIEALAQFAEAKGIARRDEQMAISRESIAEVVKALIAQRLWNTTAYFKVVNRTSPVVERAINILSE